MNNPNRLMEVITTCSSDLSANMLAEKIVAARLAACVQVVGPIRSVYWWQGAMNQTFEHKLSAKTTLAVTTKLIQFIQLNHEYEIPELLFNEVQASAEYLAWVEEQVVIEEQDENDLVVSE